MIALFNIVNWFNRIVLVSDTRFNYRTIIHPVVGRVTLALESVAIFGGTWNGGAVAKGQHSRRHESGRRVLFTRHTNARAIIIDAA